MQTLTGVFEVQIDEKPNGAVIRINDKRGCIIRVCSIPKEIVFDEKGEVRSFVDITYPMNTYNFSNYDKSEKALTELGKVAIDMHKAMVTATQKPKNQRLSRLGERLKKK